MKLTSGLEVELRPITFPERQEARNATEIGRSVAGDIVIQNSYDAQILWVRAGLKGAKGIDYKTYESKGRDYANDVTLMQLSDDDLSEISLAVIDANTQGDYAKKE